MVFKRIKWKLYVFVLLFSTLLAGGLSTWTYLTFGDQTFTPTGLATTMAEAMHVGATFTLDDLVKAENYRPSWIKDKAQAKLTILVENEQGNLVEHAGIVTVSDNVFKIEGIAKGKFQFEHLLEPTVKVAFPFATSFAGASTLSIITKNFPAIYQDNIITKEELASIKSLTVDGDGALNFNDFKRLENLKTLVINDTVAPEIEAYTALNIEVIVPYNNYLDYYNNPDWSALKNIVFPNVNNRQADEIVVVLHFQGGRINSSVDFLAFARSPVDTVNLNLYQATRVGYNFSGWHDQNGIAKSGQMAVNKSTKIFASWQGIKYQIRYNLEGGTAAGISEHNFVYDQPAPITAVIPERFGFVFAYWNTRLDGTGTTYEPGAIIVNLTTIDNEIIDLYAQWGNSEYQVFYDANGGTGAPAAQSCVFGTDVIIPSTIPTRLHYDFMGWSKSSTASSGTYFPGETHEHFGTTSDLTLYAIWQAKLVTVTFNTETPNTVEIPFDKPLTDYAPTKIGSIFLGWSLSSTTLETYFAPTLSLLDYNIKEDITTLTLYPAWQTIVYYVKFDVNGGSCSSCSQITASYGVTYTLPNPTRSNYTFDGWVRSDTGSMISNSFINLTDQNGVTITLKASWTEEGSDCFAAGTLITMADGSSKPIEALNVGELVLGWDFTTGALAASPIAIIYHDYRLDPVITLTFSDGTELVIVDNHALFSLDTLTFVTFDEFTYLDYIGHSFQALDADPYQQWQQTTALTLVSAVLTYETRSFYTVVTEQILTVYANSLLSLPGELSAFINLFTINDALQYDIELMMLDLAQYGMFTYEEFAEYITLEEFNFYNGAYLKVAVEKGLITMECLIAYIFCYLKTE